ncbi:piwi-like protein 1 [Mya arenaria]|uniref:piwi-like protein 1 n=1 Tax=Mya arenaria TaxID=6604 RepID=UPI0022E5CE08|nr:piwi-like protein 1 [Mya arenaria]
MASGGYGRGGRGQLLLQALQQPARKPGDNGQEQRAEGQSTQAPAPSKAAAPLGRGAVLANLLNKQPTPQPPAPGGDPQAARAVPRPMGRGLASMQALLQSTCQSLPQSTARGAAFMQEASQVARQPVAPPPSQVTLPSRSPPQQSSPQAQGEGTSAPPTSRLAEMSLNREDRVEMHGKDGTPLRLSANHIRIKCNNPGVYQYHVDFRPNIDSKGMRIRLVNEHRDVIGFAKAFDGSILFLPIKLPQPETILHSIRNTDNTPVTIIIRLTKVLPPESCHQLYNIVFRRIMSILSMVQVGRYFYNPNTPSVVPQHRLEVWPGYITAVSEQEGGLMLLADASHRVLTTETVLDKMQTMVQRNPQGFRDDVIRQLIGTVVLTRYNNKTYRVDDIIWNQNPQHTFSTASGGEMSFIEYYKKSYNLDIQDYEQPLLMHRPKRKQEPGGRTSKIETILLVPELCYMSGLTDALRQDFRVMKDLAHHTRVTPEQRKLTMMKFMQSVNGNPDARKELENWGLQLDNDILEFDGRQLPQEDIVFYNKIVKSGPTADWGRAATSENVITAVALRNWVVIYTRRDQTKANDYISTTLKVAPQMGIECSQPIRFELKDDRVETYIRALREHINPTLQVIVAICPTSRDDRYSAIKKTCCVDNPIPSQVIIGKTIGDPKKLRSVVQKIALQINCKLGGELWGVSIPLKHLMVVGIDIYHDSAAKKQSICGFVASMNKNCTRWFSRCKVQPVSQELVDGLKFCLVSALTKFHETNHFLPEKIVVFRDGVGDGQLNTVADYEVDQLKSTFSHFGEEYCPKMSVVIVQKRINTRIFCHKGRQLDNPPSGTVVDHSITRRDRYDYFLVSQHVRQGTVSPTHYIVVSDDTGMKPDHMQRLTYKMTHLYYNWPGTVRVPAPCQYAHKLAQLVGQNIHKEPSESLSDRLFFL